MFAILHALGMFVADLFKSRTRLETETPLVCGSLHLVFDSMVMIARFS
jgi:hypothetical protein